MKYLITMYDKSNPDFRRNVDMEFDSDEVARYQFEEGNYSCDCNRSIFCYGAERYKCNATENIIIVEKIVNTDTDKIIYTEHPLDL